VVQTRVSHPTTPYQIQWMEDRARCEQRRLERAERLASNSAAVLKAAVEERVRAMLPGMLEVAVQERVREELRAERNFPPSDEPGETYPFSSQLVQEYEPIWECRGCGAINDWRTKRIFTIKATVCQSITATN
jgi:hypothetical protein